MCGPQTQGAIYSAGVAGARPRVPTAMRELEAQAIQAMSPEAGGYIAGGAGREDTMHDNLAAFRAWKIVPRVLRDVEHRDTSTTLLGMTMPVPMLTAPIGVLEMAHPDADLAVARAVGRAGIPMIFSNQASVPMEECATALGNTPRLFQLYWSRSDDLVRSFVERAERCGCRGIVLTLDTSMLGWRPRDLDLASLPFLRGMGIAQYTSDPVFRRELDLPLIGATGNAPATRVTWQALAVLRDLLRRTPGPLTDKLRTNWPRKAVRRFVATYSRPSLQWSDLARLRTMTSLPILLKGILHPDDARLAVEHGADAIKALALGASAVLLGRPYVYGLALAGEAGVAEVLRNVHAEFDLTMGLADCTRVAGITAGGVTRG